jgi:predicted PhzF superfamily epimerase YddE/YHI9
LLLLKKIPLRGVVVTAPGEEADFVSRMFGPKIGIDEDPATGSSHCSLTPYWADKLGKSKLVARQLSKRGGEMVCELDGQRVRLTGQCVEYMQATIYI